MAFVVVQHLSPDFVSMMDELLVRQTTLPIRTVTDGIEIQPNTIYLMPPRKEMIISGGRLLRQRAGAIDHRQLERLAVAPQ